MTRIFLLVSLIAQPVHSFASTADVTLFFEDGTPFDGACNALKQHDDYKITQAMRDELSRRIPEFEKTWNEKGTPLVRAMTDLLGHPYGRKEESLTLTLCQWFSPMSSPLVLRAREYLRSTAVDNPSGPPEVKPASYFAGQIFHELIHRYLDRYFTDIDTPTASALVRSHALEPAGVLSHLHHLSVQKAVCLKLNRKIELATIIDLDSRIHGGIYKRAWEIVNADGYEKYVDELLNYKIKRPGSPTPRP